MHSLFLMLFVGQTRIVSANTLVLKEEERNMGQPQICRASVDFPPQYGTNILLLLHEEDFQLCFLRSFADFTSVLRSSHQLKIICSVSNT